MYICQPRAYSLGRLALYYQQISELTGSTVDPTVTGLMTTTPHNEASGAAEFTNIVKFWMELLIYLANYVLGIIRQSSFMSLFWF